MTTERVAMLLDIWRAGRRGVDVPDPPVGRGPRRAWLTNAAGLMRSWGVEPTPEMRTATAMRLWPVQEVVDAIAAAGGPGGNRASTWEERSRASRLGWQRRRGGSGRSVG